MYEIILNKLITDCLQMLTQYKKIAGGEYIGFNNATFVSLPSCLNQFSGSSRSETQPIATMPSRII